MVLTSWLATNAVDHQPRYSLYRLIWWSSVRWMDEALQVIWAGDLCHFFRPTLHPFQWPRLRSWCVHFVQETVLFREEDTKRLTLCKWNFLLELYIPRRWVRNSTALSAILAQRWQMVTVTLHCSRQVHKGHSKKKEGELKVLYEVVLFCSSSVSQRGNIKGRGNCSLSLSASLLCLH